MLTVPCSKGVLSFWKMNGSQYICLLEKYLGMELKDQGFQCCFMGLGFYTALLHVPSFQLEFLMFSFMVETLKRGELERVNIPVKY